MNVRPAAGADGGSKRCPRHQNLAEHPSCVLDDSGAETGSRERFDVVLAGQAQQVTNDGR